MPPRPLTAALCANGRTCGPPASRASMAVGSLSASVRRVATSGIGCGPSQPDAIRALTAASSRSPSTSIAAKAARSSDSASSSVIALGRGVATLVLTVPKARIDIGSGFGGSHRRCAAHRSPPARAR